jgi:hypothetical protein
MSFDMAQALYMRPGRKGAALRLKNGATFKATDTPNNYIGLDHRLARVRARLGIGAAHPPSPATEVRRQTTTIPNGPLFFTASRQSRLLPGLFLILVGGAIGILPVLFGLWVVFSGSMDFVDALGIILVLLVVVLCAAFFVAMGLAMFSDVAELVLDSEARQAHFVLVWPIIRPNEIIAFEDLAAAGVRETFPLGSHGVHDLRPYIRLKSGRRIDLSGFGDTFGSAKAMASRICEITGAKFQNVHEFP